MKMVQKLFRAEIASRARHLSLWAITHGGLTQWLLPSGLRLLPALTSLRSCYLDKVTHFLAQGRMTSSVRPATKVTHCIVT